VVASALLLLITACGSKETTQQTSTATETQPARQPAPAETPEASEIDYSVHPLPDNLEWITNDEDPIFASPEAQPGGTFRTYMLSFPLTLRRVGPDSNGAFAGYMRPNQMPAVALHPNTRRYVPMIAKYWAFDPDGKTVYYKINPKARWSDGNPVLADDFVFTLEFMRSRFIVAPWYNNNYTNHIVNIQKHGDRIFSVEGATPKPKEELLWEYGLTPTPRHFHKLDENWIQNTNWKIEPNTGPYQISKIQKGKYIDFARKENWWGNDEKYFKYRYNPSKIRVRAIRDTNVAFQRFLKGDIDAFILVLPSFWHQKARGPLFDKGYINRIKYYTNTPQPAAGMWLNMDEPLLADRNVRLGLAHAMNIQKVIDSVLHGDYERLNTHHEGYADYTNTSIKARPFDLKRAGEYFDAAGWAKRGDDGIRVKEGVRLSLRVIYGTPAHTDRLVVLREEAKKAGVELVLQLADSAASFKQIQEKKHQIGWMTWAGGGLTPTYWEFYHSVNAHKPQTNNIVNMDNPEMDRLIMQYRDAIDKPTRVALAKTLEQMVHDSGALIPTFKVPYTREGYWRWLKLPSTHGTRSTGSLFAPFNTRYSGGLFWIDQAAKKNTLAAKKAEQSFPPVNITDETYRLP